jgi:hypothetical protein
MLLVFLSITSWLLSADKNELFVEIPAEKSGLTWVHDPAWSEQHWLPETMLGGVAFLDFDQDGWYDIFLVNTGECEFFKPTKPLRNALYRNNHDGTFTDVTEKAGVEGKIFGMGAAVADYDNDGYPDIYQTAYGGTRLYHNNGDGTFEDVTRSAGVEVGGWTTSAVWLDFDNDGLLDIFVNSFIKLNPDEAISCGMNALGKAYYCIPTVFDPTVSVLLRNVGDGTFARASEGTEIQKTPGKALGVVATDINNDGLMDLWVSNDTVQDYLWANRGNNEWEEIGLFGGVGYSPEGTVQSGMGVESGDVDGDGWIDLLVANIDHQYLSLFINNGDESFQDMAPSSELGQSSFLLSGWGMKLFDYDVDGDVDLLVANGHPDDMIHEYSSQVTYAERLLLFRNAKGRLTEISNTAGAVFSKKFPSRGLAAGDYDNDGRKDAVVLNIGQVPLLLHNVASPENHWIGIKLIGKNCNRDGIGAWISWSAAGVTRKRFITSGGSFLSSHDLRQILGLGSATKIDWLEVKWPLPSGKVEKYTDLPIDRYVTIVEGEGHRAN